MQSALVVQGSSDGATPRLCEGACIVRIALRGGHFELVEDWTMKYDPLP
jgi:hypothetical protein